MSTTVPPTRPRSRLRVVLLTGVPIALLSTVGYMYMGTRLHPGAHGLVDSVAHGLFAGLIFGSAVSHLFVRRPRRSAFIRRQLELGALPTDLGVGLPRRSRRERVVGARNGTDADGATAGPSRRR